MAKTKKFLVFATSIGAGHIRAAQAIQEAGAEAPGCEVKVVDFLRYLSPALAKATEEAYYAATKHIPRAYKFLYDLEDRPASRIKSLQSKLGSGKMAKLLEKEQPAAVISTHFMPAGAVDQLPFKGPKTVVLTDYVAHPIWLYHHTDLFFVAHEGMRDYLRKSGIPDSKIRVTGIPIKKEFSQRQDKQQLKKELGLDVELPTIIIASGGHGIGPLKEMVLGVKNLGVPAQVVAITGNNESLRLQLTELVSKESFPYPVRVLGFVSDIHRWMAAADLLVSKAGGLTVSEALAAGLPMLVVKPTPGQEDGNTDYLLEQGAGIYVQDETRLPLVITGLLKAPLRIQGMSEAARRAAKPKAAAEIIAAVSALCGE
ncbi:MAG: glycosyltransferase [Firmicutes bacterium]|nr:glycosyltransferase [Bacillota bacterium]